MKDDTISRQAIIDAVDGVPWYHQNQHGEMVHGANPDEHQAWYKADDIYAAIDSAPSAQPVEDVRAMCGECDAWNQYKNYPQPGWIPCSRELPKKDGDYLVTTHSGQIARYIFIGGSSEEYWRRCATAWMPLPTPYREGGQDDH